MWEGGVVAVLPPLIIAVACSRPRFPTRAVRAHLRFSGVTFSKGLPRCVGGR